MATTLNQLVYNLKNIIRGGVTSDDDIVSDRQIKFWLNNVRAELIRQDINKGHSISDNIIQSLGCVNVESVDASECCGIETDCDVLRTTVQMPKPIETWTSDLITKVGSVIIGEKPFQMVPLSRIPYMGHTPFKGINNNTRAVLDGGYIYLFVPNSDKVIKKIVVEGVFSDPTEASNFTTCEGVPCYTDDSPYPISEHMIETMTKMIIATDIKIIANAPTDNIGNANFEVQPNITK